MNGLPLRDITDTDSNSIIRALSKTPELIKLTAPENKHKCICFVDEFNRQQRADLRRTFMSFFNEKRNADGSLNVADNLLFSIVCINPAGAQYKDKGVIELNDAEKTRFGWYVNLNSNPQDFYQYYKDYTVKKLAQNYGIIMPGTELATKYGKTGLTRPITAEEGKKVDRFISEFELAKAIAQNSEFSFTEDDPDELNDIHNQHGKKILVARELSTYIRASEGNVREFLNIVDSARAGMTDSQKQMFHDILDGYVIDIRDGRKEFGLNPDDPTVDAGVAVTKPAAAAKKEDDEDTDNLFVSANGEEAKEAPSPTDAQDIIKNIYKNLKI